MRYKMIYYAKPTGERVTVAESTFAGKRVKGVAVCHINDTYDKEFGDKLAQARCDHAISTKRVRRINKQLDWYKKYINNLYEELHKAEVAGDKATDRFFETKEIVENLVSQTKISEQ